MTELAKFLATLGILAFVWPAVFILAFIPFLAIEHHFDLLDDLASPMLGVLVVLICGSAATWVSIRVYRRAFRER
ncbi:MAG: hypothetical protein OXT64_01505 [Gammaproteobacteria bacterium]|nr:hypothetical protein [Gammaproteobacteria bacterium]